MIEKFIEAKLAESSADIIIREPVPFGSFAYDMCYDMAQQYGCAEVVWYSLNGTRVSEGGYHAD